MLKISNVKVYGLEESIVASGYPMLSKPYTETEFQDKLWDINTVLSDETRKTDLVEAEKRIKTAKRLGSVPTGTGHDSYLKGIIVQFDIRYPVYWTPQAQRYTHFSIESSMSSMHRLTKMNLDESFNEYVLPQVRDHVEKLIEVYNEALSKGKKTLYRLDGYTNDLLIRKCFYLEKNKVEDIKKDVEKAKFKANITEVSIEDLYMYIISSCPQGLEKTMRVSTNYLQLKTMWHQRRHHKLKDWQVFCDEIEKLPYFKELTGCGL